MGSDDFSFLTGIARQYRFRNDAFSEFICRAVGILKHRLSRYKNITSFELNDLIQEGLLQAFEAFEDWRRRENGRPKASLPWLVKVYVENRFKELAKANRLELPEENQKDNEEKHSFSPPETIRQGKFITSSCPLPRSHRLVMTVSRPPRYSARILGLSRQRVVQIKKETLKVIKAEVKST